MKEKQKIEIIKLDRPEHCGDWHDKPLKWKAAGPGSEIQKFSTRKDAEEYSSLRRRSSQNEAIRDFSQI